MKRLLFVCTGNTCRSSMAEVLAQPAAQTIGLTGWQFSSAGIAALAGAAASENAIKIMQEQGLDLTKHRATLLSKQLLQSADLVLTMTEAQRNLLVAQAPGKVYTLLEFAFDCSGDIEDPFGAGVDLYRQSARQIEAAVQTAIRLIREKSV